MLYQYGYNEHSLRRDLTAYFSTHKMSQAQAALEYAWEKHEGSKRMNGQPYIIHPLFVAKYSIAIGASSEDQVCIGLLHDVCEDCGILPTDLPFNEKVQQSVARLTFTYDFASGDSEDKKQMKKIISKCETFARLIEDPEALICKGIDRYHNLITVEELPEENIVKNVLETHRWLLPVIYSALSIRAYEKYHAQLYVLSINLRSMTDIVAMKHNITLNTMP